MIRMKRIRNGRSPKKETDPRVKDFLTYWNETFLGEIGQPYTFSFGKDGNLAKQLLSVHDLPTLQDAVRAFFKDEQCKRRGPSVGIFFQEINRLLSLKAMNPLEQAKRELNRIRGEEGKPKEPVSLPEEKEENLEKEVDRMKERDAQKELPGGDQPLKRINLVTRIRECWSEEKKKWVEED